MGQKDVSPKNGKYKIKGKNNKDLDLELSGDYIVTEFDTDLASLRTKAPNIPTNIDWFACFAVYKKKNGKKDGYANVSYTVTLDKSSVEPGKKLYAYYNDQLHDLTTDPSYKDQGNKIKFSLSVGDPPIGTG